MSHRHDLPMATDLLDAPRVYEGPVSIEYASPDTAVFRDGKGRRIDDGFLLDAARQAVKSRDSAGEWAWILILLIGLGAAVFALGHALGLDDATDRITNRNAEYQAEVDAASVDHARLPDTYCATWYEDQPVHDRWQSVATARINVPVTAVCLVKGEVYVLPEDLPVTPTKEQRR